MKNNDQNNLNNVRGETPPFLILSGDHQEV